MKDNHWMIKEVQQTLYYEGLSMSSECIQLCNAFINGNIGSEQLHEKLLKRSEDTSTSVNEINKTISNQSMRCYKGTQVLKNHLNIRNQRDLDVIEGDLTGFRLLECYLKPIEGDFDLKHLTNIHTHIFKDLFPFAGRIRQEQIMKGQTLFCNASFIESSLENLSNELKRDHYLMNKTFDAFIEGLAYYLGEWNMIHPFRDGNGRSIREFIRLLALRKGYRLSFRNIDKDELLNGMIRSSYFEYDILIDLLTKNIIEI